jgi:hypothetical protein
MYLFSFQLPGEIVTPSESGNAAGLCHGDQTVDNRPCMWNQEYPHYTCVTIFSCAITLRIWRHNPSIRQTELQRILPLILRQVRDTHNCHSSCGCASPPPAATRYTFSACHPHQTDFNPTLAPHTPYQRSPTRQTLKRRNTRPHIQAAFLGTTLRVSRLHGCVF